jgi:uncharacterized lipoprotein YmbA
MKRAAYLQLPGLMCVLGLLLSGCLIKHARVPTRSFVLAPIPPPEHAQAAAQPPSVEVGFVKMPPYLLRDALVVRKNATEFESFENALWAERLDQCFQRTLEENLSALLLTNQVYTAIAERDRLMVKISVNVQQFDVDTQGQGTLIASWRLTIPGNENFVKSGLTHLTRSGPPPLGNPQAIATTLSALTADFSGELAQAIGEAGQATTR